RVPHARLTDADRALGPSQGRRERPTALGAVGAVDRRSVPALSHAGLRRSWAQAAYRFAARARACAATTSRSFGGADVSSSESRCAEMCLISCTARANASSLAFDGLVKPLILRTYWSAAASISSSRAGGSKLEGGGMVRPLPPH